MFTTRTMLGCLLLTPMLAGGCGNAVLTGPSAVTGGVWKLQSLETLSLGLVGISRPDSYTVEFREADRIAVRADCNSCAGGYSISGESLQVGALACTRAFCGSASYDAAFLEVLTNAASLGVRGLELSIVSAKGVARLNR